MESARDTFLSGCATVAQSLIEHGFTYAKSARKARRRSGDFVCTIYFQSSHYNVGGHNVALWIHAIVTSPRLSEWRCKRGATESNDIVVGAHIGNLTHPPKWRDFNIAGPNGGAVIGEAISAVHTVALPFFDRFTDVQRLCESLILGQAPWFFVVPTIEFLLCFSDQKTTNDAVHSFFRARPDLLPEFHHHLREFAQRGLPVRMQRDYAQDLAFAVAAYGLSPPPEKNA